MKSNSRILIATDLSARSDRPLERALLLGRQLGSSVLVLHVLESRKKLGSEEEQRMRALLRAEFNLEDRNAKVCFDYGSVPITIARVAEERGCDLIVTGVARYNSPRDFVLGTAVDYLIRQSSLPTLVVKRRAHREYERLVVATDFSPAATHALLAAAKLLPNARILLVHAYEAAFQAFLDHDTTAPLIRDETEKAMERLIAKLPPTVQSRLETIVEEGRVAGVFSQHISKSGSDLLVLGTWHRRRHAHVLGSDDSWALPATEPCDVLIVKGPVPKAESDLEPSVGEGSPVS